MSEIRMSSKVAMEQFIANHLAQVEPLAREASLAMWEMQTIGSEESQKRAVELIAKHARLHSDSESYAFLKSVSPQTLESPALVRQHTLLLNAFLANQMEEAVSNQIIALAVEIETDFNTFRSQVDGKFVSDNEIDELLGSVEVKESLREEAWKASKKVGALVSERVLKLVRLRNREAKRLGFENYYAMGLHLQEIEESRLFALLDDLHEKSLPTWSAYKTELNAKLAKRFNTTPDKIRPWHFQNKFFQEPDHSAEIDLDQFFADKNLEELTSKFFLNINLPVDDLLAKADMYEREGKCQHAFCMDVDRKGDVRVLCNNRPNVRWMETTLHEFGHAVYDKFSDPNLPYLLREPAHTMTTESIALFMGRLAKNPEWLVTYAGAPTEEAERIGGEARKQVREHLLVFMHWCFVMANFERALYRDPEQDLNTLWWDLVEEYQGVARPENRNLPDWAAKVHIATAPVYYHNYQLGEMLASQLLNHLTQVVLKGEAASALVTSPKVGAWMRETLFLPGATRLWEDWLEHATGEKLNPSYFVKELG